MGTAPGGTQLSWPFRKDILPGRETSATRNATGDEVRDVDENPGGQILFTQKYALQQV